MRERAGRCRFDRRAKKAVDDEGARRLETFERMRPRLFGIAYRMLGMRAEAEDVVQDAWIRLRDTAEVLAVEGFLVQTVTRLCLDRSRSARVRRESYVGLWLPEPLPEDALADEEVEHLETLTMAMLHVIDRLSPLERAVFLLREAFDYPYDRIGELVDRRPDACRKIVSRARGRVRRGDVAARLNPDEHRDLLLAFLDAARKGDVEELEALLTEDATLLSDGGGKATSALNPVVGRTRVARFIAGVTAAAEGSSRVEVRTLNGLPAAVVVSGGDVVATFSLNVVDGGVNRIFSVRNPDKLRRLAPPDPA